MKAPSMDKKPELLKNEENALASAIQIFLLALCPFF